MDATKTMYFCTPVRRTRSGNSIRYVSIAGGMSRIRVCNEQDAAGAVETFHLSWMYAHAQKAAKIMTVDR